MRGADVFAGLSVAELEGLAGEGQYCVYTRNQCVVWPGEGARWAYLLVKGSVRLHGPFDGARPAVPLELLRGDFLEECIPGFSLDAGADGATICRISRNRLAQVRSSNPGLQEELVRRRAALVHELAVTAYEAMAFGIEERVKRFLCRRASRLGPQLKISHTDIAELVGATRQSVTAAIETLVAGGVIRCHPHHPSRIDVLETMSSQEIPEENRKLSKI